MSPMHVTLNYVDFSMRICLQIFLMDFRYFPRRF